MHPTEKEESDEELGSAEEEQEDLEPVETPKTKTRKQTKKTNNDEEKDNNNNDDNEGEKVGEEDFVVSDETPKKKETRGRPKKGEVRIPKKYVKKGRQPKAPKVWTPDNHNKEM